MQTRHAARMAAEEVAAAASAAVLFSPDLWMVLWPSLDRASKVALRSVNRAIRGQVDGLIEVVASPVSGFSADALSAALRLWPRTRDLTLLGVSDASVLAPLETASAGLTSLTVRQGPDDKILTLPELGSGVSSTLRVIDISGCFKLSSIDVVRSCKQLRCLWMPGCVRVADLSPFGACSETLEELWMAHDVLVRSLAPLKACTRLRKLDLRDCSDELHGQVAGLQHVTCTQLADPSAVELEGLVHDLQPSIQPFMQQNAVLGILHMLSGEGIESRQDAIVAAGAIPYLVQLLGPGSSADVHETSALAALTALAAHALAALAENDHIHSAISAAGAIPALVKLLGPESSADVQIAAAGALHNLADNLDAQHHSAITAAGAILALVRLLGPDVLAHVQEAVVDALCHLAFNHAQNQDVIATAGAIPVLVKLLGPESSAYMHTGAALALENLAFCHAQNQAAIVTAGAIPVLVQLLGPASSTDVQAAAASALHDLAFNHVQNQGAIRTAGAIPALMHLLEPECPAKVLATAARAVRVLTGNHAPNSAAIPGGVGAVPALLQLLGADLQADMQAAAAWALRILAANPAQNPAAIVAAGVVPALVQLMQLQQPDDVPDDVQITAIRAVWKLAADHDHENESAISAAAAISALVRLLGPGSSADVQAAATRSLRHLASLWQE
ncbi:hypothetical protein FOA52_000541 [Chlamydomonas sp. UWO 241]|nr:hypothetical protein FOA52_000541 [Chlamydomonas sp. UWO 241]